MWGFPKIDSTAVDCGAVELDDLTFHRTSFPPDEFSAGRDRNYMEDYSIVRGFPQIDSATVDYDTGTVELDDLIFSRTSFPPDELSAGQDGDYICAYSSCRKVDGPVCLIPGRVSVCFQDECGGPDVRAGRV